MFYEKILKTDAGKKRMKVKNDYKLNLPNLY